MAQSTLARTAQRKSKSGQKPEQPQVALVPSEVFPPSVLMRIAQEIKGERVGLSVDENDSLQMYLREMGRISLLSEEQEVALAERIGQGDQVARHQLVEANLRLVVSVARRYIGRGMSMDDLVQEGNLGLMHAAGNYDGSRGVRFGTYAFWWITQAITRSLEAKATFIHIPSYAYNELRAIKRVRSRFLHTLGREPRSTELVEITGIAPERIEELLRAANSPMSLDEPIYGQGEDTPLGDLLPDSEGDAVDVVATYTLLRTELNEILGYVLTEREQQVVMLRHGLFGDETHTLEEIGRTLGVSRERARQIEANAVEKLKHSPLARRLYQSL